MIELENMHCIMYVADAFRLNLRIPDYQRPYKWTQRNVTELLGDIEEAISTGKKAYRVGTLILDKKNDVNRQTVAYEIVDGQQRILTFTLILLALNPDFTSSVLDDINFQNTLTYDKVSQKNLHGNFLVIREYLCSLNVGQRDKMNEAINTMLEFVVIAVDHDSEAFQLFDSQNTRGKRLDPHDLLKAFHLREIKDRYSMRHQTEQWESAENIKIRELFNWYLYPIMNWVKREKTRTFTEKDIEPFKGVRPTLGYRYGVRIVKSMPCFQLGEQFEAGESFFEMTNHYLRMREDVETEIMNSSALHKVKKILTESDCPSTGFEYSKRLFYCAVMAYYDRFGLFDVRAICKLCLWAFTIRLDMEHLGFDTINNYAIGIDSYGKYSNCLEMFLLIKTSRSHLDVANMLIKKNSKNTKYISLRNNLEALF